MGLLLAAVTVVLHLTGALDGLEQRYRPSSPRTTPYADLFRAAAERYPAVSAAQLAAHARAESGFDPDAVSPAGAQGLMQIVPGTFGDFGRDADGDGEADPFDPADSVETAAAYLTWIGEQLDLPVSDERVIAAYNAGPGAVQEAGGVPDFEETRTYVERVTGWVPGYGWLDRPA
ncbi:lytic transglycosylase domain-containing protein [Vallicoccus soli]|uniref:lytic transglycosylase domain-containing protein n=1 Tax=Vallicoccus soli TaxID=2339232 RepID=UPI001C498609|nr:lytic transglycosylase domain-containing protein [Vallicoccus soli]